MAELTASLGSWRDGLAAKALQASGVFWLAVALIGQWAFFYYIIAFYGASTLSGDLEVWNRLTVINGGHSTYVADDPVGNFTFGAHALAAGIIAFGGALQLVPQIRSRFPTFHRWNGRLFLLTVVGLSLSGFYLVWIRNRGLEGANVGSLASDLAITLNGALILTFAALAVCFAMARDIAIHSRWAMRLYLVSNAQWFLRVGMFAYVVVNMALGNEPRMSPTFFAFWTWGCYLVPLAVLQLYFLAQDRGGAWAHATMASLLVGLTVLMAAGIVVFAVFSQALVTGAPLALPG